MKRIIANLIVVLFAVWFFQKGVRPETDQAFRLDQFSNVPVKYEGRKKPVDTLARNLLTILSNKQSLRTEDGKISAMQWFLDTISGRAVALEYEVFRIENFDVLTNLGLEERKGFRYSYNELLPNLGKIESAYRAAFAKESRERDLYDRQMIKLGNMVYTLQHVMGSFEDPLVIPRQQLMATTQCYMQMENNSIPLIIPPMAGKENWRPLMSALLALHPGMGIPGAEDPLASGMREILVAYRIQDAVAFNQKLAEYEALLRAENPAALNKISFEVFYNRLNAFGKSKWLYLFVFLFSCFGWLFRKNGLLAVGCSLMIAAFIPHTFAIVARCFLSGYPPVTNLYSSAIFIGWGAVAIGILVEMGFRKRTIGVGTLIGSIGGYCTLLIAQYLAGDGDTMEQMRAVLDTRFWLTTHVITISIGYVATFVSGIIAVFYIISGLFTRRLDEVTEDDMYRMMYGTTCFALLLSFVGTVLGGLWADDSWGRFWGWDPKENGALLIVIWNAIMLHARYGKMIKHRGFAIMAVFGNVVTAWSWFGVNQLNVGLHTYGFTDSASRALSIFVWSQVLICLAGLIPSRHWKSGATQ